MNLGDICWVDLPAGAGRAQAGRRPAIVFQTSALPDSLPTVLLIPLTTQHGALRFPGTVLIEADARNKLSRASVALVFQMAAIDKRYVGPTTGLLSLPVVDSLNLALDQITGRDRNRS